MPFKASRLIAHAVRFVPDWRDAAALIGGVMIARGAGLAWTPAGWMVGGLELLLLAFLSYRGDALAATLPPSAAAAADDAP